MSEGKNLNYYLGRMTLIDLAEQHENFHLMFRLLKITSDSIHPLDRAKLEETIANLEKMVMDIETTNGRTYNHSCVLRSTKAHKYYLNGGRTAKLEVYATLWDGGYLSKDLFRRARPLAGDEKSGTVVHEGFAPVLSSGFDENVGDKKQG